MPISVLIADHQYLTREGLYSSLNKENDLNVVTVDNWLNIQPIDNLEAPDVLILDYTESELSTSNQGQLKELVELYSNVLIISADQNKDRIRKVLSLVLKVF